MPKYFIIFLPLSLSGCLICNLLKATTIEVAYAKRAMSKRWDASQVHCTSHSSLWADLGMIMMDGIVAELDFVNSTSNPVVIKSGEIVATAI